MSRILRRPMFRGGRVSSYGTGIAAPLVPGYKGGGQIGGGIIYGKPMADGRYGFQAPDVYPKGIDLLKKNVSSSMWDMTPDQALKMAEAYRMGSPADYIPDSNEIAENEAGKINEVESVGEEKELPKSSYEKMMENSQWGEQDITKKEEYTIDDLVESYKKDGTPIKDLIEFSKKENVYIDTDGNKRNRTTGELITEKGKGTEWDPGAGNEQVKVVDPDQKWKDEIARLNAIIAGGTEEPTVDAKTMVAENKELFRDLLGWEKAKGQDISEMLLGFAGAEGDDTWSKAKSFFRDEAKRPGKAQKIDETAAALAINDYVAGKRSKENIKQLMAIEDYKPKAKLKATMPSKDDTAQVALYKIAALNDSKIGSDTTLKQFIKLKTGESAIRNDKIKMKDLDNKKKQKKLNIGYNIIEEDQVKNIVYWDGTNYDIVTLEQIWAKE